MRNECGIDWFDVEEAWKFLKQNPRNIKYLKTYIINFLIVIGLGSSRLCGPQGQCCRKFLWISDDDPERERP